jgi:hypothetical protein
MRALCLHLNEATSMFQLSRDPRTFFALDQAIDNLTFAQNVCRGSVHFMSLKVAVFITGFCLAALDCFDERRDKGSYHFFVPFPREAESREETHPSEKLLCLSHVRIACSSCWDVDEDTGCETGQQEVTGKLSQIRQLNPLSL